ncbi:Uncharacterised protein [Bordetella pertussis]|nr:Uncharacterised protein [Bordetella pertussis]CPI27731.1 Uncharacterised protein [Bordetella pertussis]CPN90406.1 Uncharacterised protein [Bordetella pertussis]CPO70579.1 Uncharacterised protein [Bordetella pertussis]
MAWPALMGVRRMDWNSSAGNSTKYTMRSVPAKNSRENPSLWRRAQPRATSMKSGKTSRATDMEPGRKIDRSGASASRRKLLFSDILAAPWP